MHRKTAVLNALHLTWFTASRVVNSKLLQAEGWSFGFQRIVVNMPAKRCKKVGGVGYCGRRPLQEMWSLHYSHGSLGYKLFRTLPCSSQAFSFFNDTATCMCKKISVLEFFVAGPLLRNFFSTKKFIT